MIEFVVSCYVRGDWGPHFEMTGIADGKCAKLQPFKRRIGNSKLIHEVIIMMRNQAMTGHRH